MTTGISNLLRRRLRTDQILDRLERIEQAMRSDQILERLERIERIGSGFPELDAKLQTIQAEIGATREEIVGTRREAISISDIAAARQEIAATREEIVGTRREAAPTTSGEVVLGLHMDRLRERFGRLDLVTDFPIAQDSPDHQVPWGTAQDNSTNLRFNARLLPLLPVERMSLLDLGCSGGGQVRSFIEQGVLAVGIEGSDYSCRRLRAEWLTIPEFLFTGDITRPFQVQCSSGDVFRFAVVTLWEVIEHIREADLAMLFRNIDAHLLPGGLVIMSVSPNSDVIEGTELHQTIRPREWWVETLATLGWENNPEIIKHFHGDFVRDESNAPNSFHLALSRRGAQPVLAPRYRHLLRGPASDMGEQACD
jgi:2-polyprenyl-3-methyl-5-hydroxy-6-metoxy-1,4-benzoquinol methylase